MLSTNLVDRFQYIKSFIIIFHIFQWPEFENITSLQICVKFPASVESWNLFNLSSSQKALVVCAFNFSILQICPVPICILDEIDRVS